MKSNVCDMLREHFRRDPWDDGRSWPSLVMVNGEFYMKIMEPGYCGNPGYSHYEHVDKNAIYTTISLDELAKENG